MVLQVYKDLTEKNELEEISSDLLTKAHGDKKYLESFCVYNSAS